MYYSYSFNVYINLLKKYSRANVLHKEGVAQAIKIPISEGTRQLGAFLSLVWVRIAFITFGLQLLTNSLDSEYTAPTSTPAKPSITSPNASSPNSSNTYNKFVPSIPSYISDIWKQI